jgi:hypothetical protein
MGRSFVIVNANPITYRGRNTRQYGAVVATDAVLGYAPLN